MQGRQKKLNLKEPVSRIIFCTCVVVLNTIALRNTIVQKNTHTLIVFCFVKENNPSVQHSSLFHALKAIIERST